MGGGSRYPVTSSNEVSTVAPVSGSRWGTSGVVAWVGEMDALTPAPIGVQAMRTEFGRPNSSMRLRT